MDCSQPGPSVHGISYARILKWVAHLLLQGIFPTQDQTHVSYVFCAGKYILYLWAAWKAWMGLHAPGGGWAGSDMLNRVTQQEKWDHPITTGLDQPNFTPQLPLMGLDIWWREKRVLLPRKKVEGSLATVKLGIKPRARNEGSALYRTAQFSQTSVPWTLSSQLFALFIHSYISYLSLLQLLSYF